MLSVVVPFYNRNHVIDRCLKSILAELEPGDEIIVVDDCSQERFQSSYRARVKYVGLEKNCGPVSARLQGARIATNGHILFFDSDDELLPGWREYVARMLPRLNDCGVIFFPIYSTVLAPEKLVRTVKEYWEWVGDNCRKHDYVPLMRRSQAVAMLDHLRASEMWLFIRIFENGRSALYLSQPIYIYHNDAGNQLSRERGLKFEFNGFERSSLGYVIGRFLAHRAYMRRYAPAQYFAWRRHLIKRSLLQFRVISAVKLII